MSNLKDIKDRSVHPALIATLETMLEQARKGEFRSLYYVKGWSDDNVSHGWVMDKRSNRRMMLAEMTLGLHDMTVNIELQDKDTVLSNALGLR